MRKTRTIKIIRKSINTFLQNYIFFTNISILALPFSALVLLSTSASLDSISLQNAIHFCLLSLFDTIGIQSSSDFPSIFDPKLSQTITSTILLLPFTFTFLITTKTYIIESFNTNHKRPRSSFTGIFKSILQTQLWNSFIVISTYATSFWILFIAFNCLEYLKIFSSSTLIILFTMVRGITYSILAANSMIICNMALVLSGMETKGGFISILKACVMVRRRSTTALSLALCINITLAGIESLFRFRMSNIYASSRASKPSALVQLEGLFIAYLYSIIITLDTITCCIFYKRCNFAASNNVLDQEEVRRHGYCLEVKTEEVQLH